MYVCMYVCMNIDIYIYVCLYIYIDIYIYILGWLKKIFFKYSCLTTLMCDISYKNNMYKILFS